MDETVLVLKDETAAVLMEESSSVAVHALGAEASVVVGSDGSRWHVSASAATLGSPEGASVLADLRARVVPGPRPSVGRGDAVFRCAAEVATWAGSADADPAGVTAVVPYAGRWYRLRLSSRDGVPTATLAVGCLRSTVAEADLAEALLHPPDIVLGDWHLAAADAGPDGPPSLDHQPLGTLARWDDGAWSPHQIDPAPVVDPVTGLVRRIVVRPVDPLLPPGFRHLHAELPYLASIDPTYQPDMLAPSGVLDDGRFSADELDEPAVLSGIAHYCGAYLGQGTLRQASPRDHRNDGARTVSVADWGPHDPRLHQMPGFPFVTVDDEAPTWWLAGDEAGERCWVPLSLVHAGYPQSGLPGLAPTNTHNLVGLAAGRTHEEAVERACAHVVSHDAVAAWWSSDHQAHSVPVPERVLAAWGGCELQLRILDIPSTTGVPVRLAVVDDSRTDIVSLGHGASSDPAVAAELAVVEALIQHVSARDLASASSLVRDAERLGNGGVAGLAPHDPQRRFASAFGPTFRGLIDPMAHVQLGLDPSIVATTRRRTASAGPAQGTMAPSDESVRASLERAGHRIVRVDVATPRVRSARMHALRVVVPGLARLQPAAFPLDPQGRLAVARRALGWGTAARPVPYPGW